MAEDKHIDIGHDNSGIANSGNHNIIIQIVSENFGKDASSQKINDAAKQIFQYLQEDKKELVVIDQELKEHIAQLTQQMQSKGLIEEILNEERTKRKALEKELDEFKAKAIDNPTLEELIEKATQALENFEYQKYHEILDSYSDDKEIAQIKYLKAKEYYNRLLYQDAKKQMHKVVALDEDNYEYNHWYGKILYTLGQYDNALKYYEKSLNIELKNHQKPTANTATAYNQIGGMWHFKGNYPKAIEYYEKSLAIRLKTTREEHPDTATTYNNLGEAYRAKCKYTKAMEYYEKSLAIRLKTTGDEHPNTAATYNNLGLVYEARLKYQKAYKYMQKTINIVTKTLPANHPYVIKSKRDLERIKTKL
ncbi:MAG: tetratricopeptide repeat protein [Campylobacterales bacterium]|nr:tetratricopeptide repeat protein [Campylobacterales bacterium]